MLAPGFLLIASSRSSIMPHFHLRSYDSGRVSAWMWFPLSFTDTSDITPWTLGKLRPTLNCLKSSWHPQSSWRSVLCSCLEGRIGWGQKRSQDLESRTKLVIWRRSWVGLLFGYERRNWMTLRRNRSVRVILFCFVALGVVLKVKGTVWV